MGISEILRGLGGPVAYHPSLAKHVGGVKPAILLCQLIYWSGKTDRDLGVYKSADEWERETGLSYREQATARRELVSRGLMVETAKRLEHKIYFLLVQDVLDDLLMRIAKGEKRISPNAESAFGESTEAHFVHTENTTKTTKPSDQQADLSALDKVNDLYNQITSGVFVRSRGLNDAKIKNIRACFKMKIEGRPLFRSLEFWEKYFAFCLKNPHWRGETGTFKARLEFLTRKDIVQRTVDDLLEEMGVDDAA